MPTSCNVHAHVEELGNTTVACCMTVWCLTALCNAGSSDGSWDIDTACADGHSTPRFQVMASRQHSGMTTSSHDIEDASEVQYAVFVDCV